MYQTMIDIAVECVKHERCPECPLYDSEICYECAKDINDLKVPSDVLKLLCEIYEDKR